MSAAYTSAPEGSDLAGDSVGTIAARVVVDRDVGAVLGEHDRGGGADASAGTRNQRDAIVES
jgi:hypothetical protein